MTSAQPVAFFHTASVLPTSHSKRAFTTCRGSTPNYPPAVALHDCDSHITRNSNTDLPARLLYIDLGLQLPKALYNSVHHSMCKTQMFSRSSNMTSTLQVCGMSLIPCSMTACWCKSGCGSGTREGLKRRSCGMVDHTGHPDMVHQCIGGVVQVGGDELLFGDGGGTYPFAVWWTTRDTPT